MLEEFGIEYQISTATLVHLATLTYVFGFILTNQMALRGLILLGSAFYIVYYYSHLGTPQWDAIVGSLLIVAATLIGMAQLVCGRLTIGMSDEHRQLFGLFGTLAPGELRTLLRAGDVITAKESVRLTTEGATPDRLYFVVAGTPLIDKAGTTFAIERSCFIGEVGFLLQTPASATVTLPKGGRYIEWRRDTLLRVLDRSASLRQAFDALLGRDMAIKVAASAQAVPGPAGTAPTHRLAA